MSEGKKFIIRALYFISLLLIVVLIPMSIKDVEQDEYAIRFDIHDPVLQKKIYEEGRHFLDPDTKMVKFNRKFVTMDFVGPDKIVCWTHDGLEMHLNILTQYQIIRDELYNLVNDEFRNQKAFLEYLKPLIAGSFMD